MVLHSDPTHAERVVKLPAGVREFWNRARRELDLAHERQREQLLATCEAMGTFYPLDDTPAEDKELLRALKAFILERATRL